MKVSVIKDRVDRYQVEDEKNGLYYYHLYYLPVSGTTFIHPSRSGIGIRLEGSS